VDAINDSVSIDTRTSNASGAINVHRQHNPDRSLDAKRAKSILPMAETTV
jgi:hypothetical protein